MKRKYLMQVLLYGAFALLVLFAVFVSGKLTEGGEKRIEPIPEFSVMLEGKEISALYYDTDHMWVGCNDGIYLFDHLTMEILQVVDDLQLVYTSAMVQTPDGTVWVGHEHGLTGFTAEGERVEFRYPEIPKGRVNAVEWDGENLWCGTYHGAARMKKNADGWCSIEYLDQSQGLISDSVNVIKQIGDELWFASYLDHQNGGLTIKGKNVLQIGVDDGLIHPYITSLQEVGEGKVLAGCGYMRTGGLALLEKHEGIYAVTQTFEKEDGLPGEKVRYLYEDENGYLWITTEYDGILIVNQSKDGLTKPLKGLYYTVEHGLSDNEIKCIAESEENYWLGGKYGLTIISKEYINEQMKK